MEFKDLDWEEKKLVWRITSLADILETSGEDSKFPFTYVGLSAILEDIGKKLEEYLTREPEGD